MSTGVTKLTAAQVAANLRIAADHGYFMRVAIVIDMLGNVVFRGRIGETLSSRAARAALQGKRWGIILSKLLDVVGYNHGAGAIVGDYERAESIAMTEAKSGVGPLSLPTA